MALTVKPSVTYAMLIRNNYIYHVVVVSSDTAQYNNPEQPEQEASS